MIVLHRLTGAPFAVNPELVVKAESTPDTVLTLSDGGHLVVRESVAEIREQVVAYRAEILARAWAELDAARPDDGEPSDGPRPVTLRVVTAPAGSVSPPRPVGPHLGSEV